MNIGTAIGAGLTLVGGAKAAKGYKKTGKAAKRRGQEQQVYNEIAATQAIAVGQIAAFEEERQARLVASRAVAVAAAGGSVMDITNLLADIEGEGAYRASIAMFEAENEANRLKFEGEQAAKYGVELGEQYEDRADATRLQTLGSMFSFLPLPAGKSASKAMPKAKAYGGYKYESGWNRSPF